MLELGATKYDWAMANAAKGGHVEVVELMLEKGATDYTKSLLAACQAGHLSIAKLMLDRGTDKGLHNLAMALAAYGRSPPLGDSDAVHQNHLAEGGHLPIVRLLINHGATDYKRAIMYARAAGQTEVIQYIERCSSR